MYVTLFKLEPPPSTSKFVRRSWLPERAPAESSQVSPVSIWASTFVTESLRRVPSRGPAGGRSGYWAWAEKTLSATRWNPLGWRKPGPPLRRLSYLILLPPSSISPSLPPHFSFLLTSTTAADHDPRS